MALFLVFKVALLVLSVVGLIHGQELNEKEIQSFLQNYADDTQFKTASTSRPFLCHPNRTHASPTSVHNLRPEDVRVVAAIGDSLTAGMGIYSKYLFTMFTQYRGHSFTMGGAGSLEEHASMPNILKKFSPQLRGFSTGISGPDGINAHLNVAVVGDKAEDMPYQARKLVKRIQDDNSINFHLDWKIVNLFIGGNDICEYCKDPFRHGVDLYKSHIMEALDFLQEKLPRTFVNLIEVVDASAVADLKLQGTKCRLLLSTFWCKCAATRPRPEVEKYTQSLQEAASEIVDSGRYDDKDDFAVVLQPFCRKTRPPSVKPGELDMTYLAPDCFHFSAVGHAEAAVALWNNMVEPVGQKQDEWSIGQPIKCPSQEKPYLCTKKNCQ